jgi:transcriptional regulator with XRE-family HTH domain
VARSVSEIDKIIGSRLKSVRQGAKLTQTDLGKFVDASFQQIQKYERGMNRISSAALLQFAQALDVPVMYFFEGLSQSQAPKRKARPAEAFERFAKSRQAESVLRKFFALRTDEERQLVLSLLNRLG